MKFKILLISIVFVLIGCSFVRISKVSLNAKGAKKLDTGLDKGDALYESQTCVSLFQKCPQEIEVKDGN